MPPGNQGLLLHFPPCCCRPCHSSHSHGSTSCNLSHSGQSRDTIPARRCARCCCEDTPSSNIPDGGVSCCRRGGCISGLQSASSPSPCCGLGQDLPLATPLAPNPTKFNAPIAGATAIAGAAATARPLMPTVAMTGLSFAEFRAMFTALHIHLGVMLLVYRSWPCWMWCCD